MELRNYRQGEEQEIFEVVSKVLSEYGLKTNPAKTDKDISDIQENYIKSGGIFKVIENEAKIVGSYGLYPLSPTSYELRKMYLLKEFQGKGFGKLMMDDMIETARQMGFKEIVLETNSILAKAIKLYEKYGFESYEPAHLSDRCDCAMRLSLS